MSFVTLGARDLERIRAFYKGLGWEPGVDVENFVSFLLGGVVLGIYAMENLNEESAPGLAADGGWSGVTLACNVADPEGNRWEIAWAEGLEWNENGAVTKFGDSPRVVRR
ncbi:MAG: glyoxalase [Actinomycetota bacterium]|nr:glyoxalase [Actinomycetota bacterium]